MQKDGMDEHHSTLLLRTVARTSVRHYCNMVQRLTPKMGKGGLLFSAALKRLRKGHWNAWKFW